MTKARLRGPRTRSPRPVTGNGSNGAASGFRLAFRGFLGFAQGTVDLLVGLFSLAVEDLGVEAVEDGDAVSGAAGDFDGVDAGGEPEGNACVAIVIKSSVAQHRL